MSFGYANGGGAADFPVQSQNTSEQNRTKIPCLNHFVTQGSNWEIWVSTRVQLPKGFRNNSLKKKKEKRKGQSRKAPWNMIMEVKKKQNKTWPVPRALTATWSGL